MLKLILISCILIYCSSAFPFLSGLFGTSEAKRNNMTEMIRQNKYPYQEHVVLTNDGYLLDLVRMRSNSTVHHEEKKNKKFDEASVNSWFSTEIIHSQANGPKNDDEDDVNFRDTKPVVLLMPALLATAESFLIGGCAQGLAFKLADEGFDVFIGNVRGSTYGSKHSVFKSEQDSLFWKFGLYELATQDLPSIINEIIHITKVKSIKYVGHMEGSTLMYILLSEYPEYNDKISSMVSLGPVAMMKQSENIILKDIAQHLSHKGWLIKNLGMDKFTPSQELIQSSDHDCTEHNEDSIKMCQDIFFLLNGYNFKNINKTTVQTLMQIPLESTSTKVIKNYAQFILTGRFGKCLTTEDTCNIVRDYNLREITVPISMIYTSNDVISSTEDVRKLIEKLPTVRDDVNVPNYSSNLELLFGNDISTIVLPTVVKGLRNHML